MSLFIAYMLKWIHFPPVRHHVCTANVVLIFSQTRSTKRKTTTKTAAEESLHSTQAARPVLRPPNPPNSSISKKRLPLESSILRTRRDATASIASDTRRTHAGRRNPMPKVALAMPLKTTTRSYSLMKWNWSACLPMRLIIYSQNQRGQLTTWTLLKVGNNSFEHTCLVKYSSSLDLFTSYSIFGDHFWLDLSINWYDALRSVSNCALKIFKF